MFNFLNKHKATEIEPDKILDIFRSESMTKESDYLKRKRMELIEADAASAKPMLLIHGRKTVNLLGPTVLKVKKSKTSVKRAIKRKAVTK